MMRGGFVPLGTKIEEVEIEVEAANDAADEIFGFFKPLQPNLQPVDECMELQVEKGQHQGLTSGSPSHGRKLLQVCVGRLLGIFVPDFFEPSVDQFAAALTISTCVQTSSANAINAS